MIKNGYKYKIKKPKGYDKMLEIVENVSKKLNRHCNIYLINGDVYFGGLHFYRRILHVNL